MASPPEPEARDLWELDPLSRTLILGLALDQKEIDGLVDCPEAAHCFERSPDDLRRHRLHVDCRHNSNVCRRTADRLDHRHAETVQFVRNATLLTIEETIDAGLRTGLQRDLPALLWAVSTDSRTAVRELGSRLATDIMSHACDLIREVIDFSSPRENPEEIVTS